MSGRPVKVLAFCLCRDGNTSLFPSCDRIISAFPRHHTDLMRPLIGEVGNNIHTSVQSICSRRNRGRETYIQSAVYDPSKRKGEKLIMQSMPGELIVKSVANVSPRH